MNTLIKWGLWQRRWSITWWSFSVVAMIVLIMALYPTFRDKGAELQQSLGSIPEASLQLLGGGSGFFSPVGYLNSQIFYLTLPMLFGILGITLGSKLIAKEEQDGTIDTLLARPKSRTNLLISKSIVGFLTLLIVSLAGLIATLASAKLVSLDVATNNILVAYLSSFLLALSFSAIAFMLTAVGRARGLSIGLTSAIAIGGYIISSLADTVEWLKIPTKFMPFHYFQPELILKGTYDWSNMLILLVITIACGIVSWLAFRKRDIY